MRELKSFLWIFWILSFVAYFVVLQVFSYFIVDMQPLSLFPSLVIWLVITSLLFWIWYLTSFIFIIRAKLRKIEHAYAWLFMIVILYCPVLSNYDWQIVGVGFVAKNVSFLTGNLTFFYYHLLLVPYTFFIIAFVIKYFIHNSKLAAFTFFLGPFLSISGIFSLFELHAVPPIEYRMSFLVIYCIIGVVLLILRNKAKNWVSEPYISKPPSFLDPIQLNYSLFSPREEISSADRSTGYKFQQKTPLVFKSVFILGIIVFIFGIIYAFSKSMPVPSDEIPIDSLLILIVAFILLNIGWPEQYSRRLTVITVIVVILYFNFLIYFLSAETQLGFNIIAEGGKFWQTANKYWYFIWSLYLPVLWLYVTILFRCRQISVYYTFTLLGALLLFSFSCLNDLLYFILNREVLPDYWPWIYFLGPNPTLFDIIRHCFIFLSLMTFLFWIVNGLAGRFFDFFRKKRIISSG